MDIDAPGIVIYLKQFSPSLSPENLEIYIYIYFGFNLICYTAFKAWVSILIKVCATNVISLSAHENRFVWSHFVCTTEYNNGY